MGLALNLLAMKTVCNLYLCKQSYPPVTSGKNFQTCQVSELETLNFLKL